MKKERKSQSGVIVTVLLILIAIAALTTVGVFVNKIVKDNISEASAYSSISSLEISGIRINETTALISIHSIGENNPEKIVISLSNGAQSKTYNISIAIEAFETKTIGITPLPFANINLVELYPIITDSETGKEIIGKKADSVSSAKPITNYGGGGGGSSGGAVYVDGENSSCTPNFANTSWSSWNNISCLPSNLMNQSRNLTQYDVNNCVVNTTFFEYRQGLICQYESYSDSGDYFSWDSRVDRHGKPTGIFDTTPFPITESTTSYTIKNDEFPDGKTYYLGTKYYVDGGFNGPIFSGNWTNPWKNLTSAMSHLTKGSITIVVRGAHDSFDGVYNEHIYIESGIDDTNRYTIVGYGQERPILNNPSMIYNTVKGPYGENKSYFTLQRFKLQNNYLVAFRTSNTHSYLNVIDVWMYNNSYSNGTSIYGDGNLYFLGSDNNWIFHSVSERSFGHGFKMGDGASNNILEWSIAKEAGYWEDNFPYSSYFSSTATAIDIPNDHGDSDKDGFPDRGVNNIIRYNIVNTSLYYGVQLRRTPNFSFHHNEIIDACKFDAVNMSVKGASRTQIYIGYEETYGNFYSNIIRDPGSNNTAAIMVTGCDQSSLQLLNFYNNLVYGGVNSFGSLPYGGTNAAGIYVGSSTNLTVNVFSNTFYTNTGGNILYISSSLTGVNDLNFTNNIFYQAGSGSAIGANGIVVDAHSSHSYNLYYSPLGSLGVNLGAGEINADPKFQSIPSREYSTIEGSLSSSSPAIDNGITLSLFNTSFNSIIRPQGSAWDIGAYEYSP